MKRQSHLPQTDSCITTKSCHLVWRTGGNLPKIGQPDVQKPNRTDYGSLYEWPPSQKQRPAQHLADLRESFTILQQYKMKPNPLKCPFGVGSYKFLGFIVSRAKNRPLKKLAELTIFGPKLVRSSLIFKKPNSFDSVPI